MRALFATLFVAACSASPPRAVAVAPPPRALVEPPPEEPLRLTRLPRASPAVVERRDGVARVVWGALRAELRGREVSFAEPGDAAITDVARDGAAWRFLDADGAVTASDTFLGPMRHLARSSSARVGEEVAVHAGPLSWIDTTQRAWRVAGDAVVETAAAWPAAVDALRFFDARDGVMSVDGPLWLRTRDGGATWSLARAPSRCADPRGSELPAPDPASRDALVCTPRARRHALAEHRALGLRVAFAYVAHEPAWLPALDPVQLDDDTLAAWDGERLFLFDAATWRVRRSVPTAWPRALRLAGRHGDDLLGETAEPSARFRLGADGTIRPSTLGPPSIPVGEWTLVQEALHRTGGPRPSNPRVEPVACSALLDRHDEYRAVDCALGNARWTMPGGCGFPSLLFGDRVVGACSSSAGSASSLRAWRSVEGVVDAAGEALFEGDFHEGPRVTSDGRWLYGVTDSPSGVGLRVVWSHSSTDWRSAPLPRGCWGVSMVSPEAMVASCGGGRVVRTGDGGATWEDAATLRRPAVPSARTRDPKTLCTSRYCLVDAAHVLVAPWGAHASPMPPPTATPHVAARVPPPRPLECVALRRLPVGGAVDPTSQLAREGFASVITPDARDDGPTRAVATWAGVDARGVYSGSRVVSLHPSFMPVEDLRFRVTRAGLELVTRDSIRGPLRARIPVAGPVRYGLDDGLDEGRAWLVDAGCPLPPPPPSLFGRGPCHDEDLRRPIADDRLACGLFARADRCGVAVMRDGAAALHASWPSSEADPERVVAPDLARAMPCRAAASPASTRWRVRFAARLVGRDGIVDEHLADVETSPSGTCIRAISPLVREGSVALRTRPDGAMHGVGMVDGHFAEVRCALR